VSGLGRAAAAVRRGAVRLVPAGRRDWVEAVWAEAAEVSPGLRRLAWRAGGVRLIAREAGMVRRIGGLLLFAVAVAAAARVAWPGSAATVFSPVARVDVITIVSLLAGLPLLARLLLGPPDSRPARWLRLGSYAALLALLPVVNAVEQFSYTMPRVAADLRVYLLVANPAHHSPGGADILVLVVAGLYLAAILWMTSHRSGIAPATLAAGAAAGIAFGLVMYAVAPLGLSKEATNPWLPGSDIDPLMLLAWLLLLGGPVAAAVAADRRYTAASSSLPPAGARFRQMLAAGMLATMVGATFVTVAGFGTTAAMLKATWLRDWLYHGQHLLYGVQNLSADLKTLPVIAYSHQLTGSMDTGAFFGMLIIFPVITLATTGLIAACRAADDAAPAPGDTRPGGGPPGPGPAAPEPPEPPDGGRLALTDDDAALAAGSPALHQPGTDIEQDRLVAAPR
jgi:hypothetical protein